LLSIGISLALWKGVSYHSELVKLRSSPTHIDKSIQPGDHIGSRPFYIFTDKKVQWKDLVPYLETLYGKHVEKQIVGTFPVPHNFNGTDITHVKSDDENIYFPSYGRFYLHTTVGFFKILLLNPELSEDEKILSIGSFVSGNAVHSLADVSKMRSSYEQEKYATDLLRKIFFASDQPLKLHCGQITRFLALILSQLGYRVQQIQLLDQNRKHGHIVMQVFLPKKNKFAMIDPDYGAIVRDKSGNVLSIQEIAILVREKPNSIMIEDIGNKNWLRERYNSPEPMPDFAWTPYKSGKIKAVRKDRYIQVMKKNSAVYWIYNRSAGEWEYPKKFHWDGTWQKKNKTSLKSSCSLSEINSL
jgi:hypothetical protein